MTKLTNRSVLRNEAKTNEKESILSQTETNSHNKCKSHGCVKLIVFLLFNIQLFIFVGKFETKKKEIEPITVSNIV